MSYLIAAVSNEGGIGFDNDMPWRDSAHSKDDLQYFKQLTSGGAVIMGYNTYVSMGKKPLPNRINIIVTKSHYAELKDIASSAIDIEVFDNLDSAIKYGQQFENRTSADLPFPQDVKKCFIIGGAQIYEYYLRWYNPKEIYLTQIPGSWTCDTFFPIEALKKHVSFTLNPESRLQFHTLTCHTGHEEQCYLHLFRDILGDKGISKGDRTGTGTRSYFSPPNLEFSLRNGNVPVLTTKRVALQTGVIPELLWFMRGLTDTKILEKDSCNIWKGNTSRKFLDSRGLSHYDVGELGPGYGFQWRHAGATYRGIEGETDDNDEIISYKDQGVDQLQDIVDAINNNPDSRRMLLVSWAPAFIEEMALPPCHVLYQTYTYVGDDGQRYLSAKMYQRSADSFLGVPFNIASYAILTHLLAQITGTIADRIIFTYGDYHIYNNHIHQVQEQLKRDTRPFPKIRFNKELKGCDVGSITVNDFDIVGYNPHPKIAAPMSI